MSTRVGLGRMEKWQTAYFSVPNWCYNYKVYEQLTGLINIFSNVIHGMHLKLNNYSSLRDLIIFNDFENVCLASQFSDRCVFDPVGWKSINWAAAISSRIFLYFYWIDYKKSRKMGVQKHGGPQAFVVQPVPAELVWNLWNPSVGVWIKCKDFLVKNARQGGRNEVINHFVQFLQGHTHTALLSWSNSANFCTTKKLGSRRIGIEPPPMLVLLWVKSSKSQSFVAKNPWNITHTHMANKSELSSAEPLCNFFPSFSGFLVGLFAWEFPPGKCRLT